MSPSVSLAKLNGLNEPVRTLEVKLEEPYPMVRRKWTKDLITGVCIVVSEWHSEGGLNLLHSRAAFSGIHVVRMANVRHEVSHGSVVPALVTPLPVSIFRLAFSISSVRTAMWLHTNCNEGSRNLASKRRSLVDRMVFASRFPR